MALDSLTLTLLGVMGLGASIGMLRQTLRIETQTLLGATATAIWSFFGFASFDVIVGISDTGAPTTRPMFPLVFLGVIFAVLSLVVTFDRLSSWLTSAAGDSAGLSSLRR